CASDEMLGWVRTNSEGADALVAVGSGSINDVCKYNAQRTNRPYLVIPTAASMNGYVSANASIRVQGYKQTFSGMMPQAVLCDMALISGAPARLNKSGLGDSLARSTAQADWLLSHLILGTPYDDELYTPLIDCEEELFSHAKGVAEGHPESLQLLMQTLLMSGIGMTAAGGSYPASQAEHMIAHAYGMMKFTQPVPKTFHGEEIGVTVLTMARLQEKLLHKMAAIRKDDFDLQEIQKHYGNKMTLEAQALFAKKYAGLREHSSHIAGWQDMAGKIDEITIAPSRLQQVLTAMDAPTTPEALGWNPMHYAAAGNTARYMRDRFTFLDLQ
ncbi:MAG: iron-containing alcohol dehydrogenase, partial [Alphaproteobacteria bacterium]